MQKIQFSPKLIENLKEGTASDPQTPGLAVLARLGVAPVFQIKRKVRGTNRVFKKIIGTYPAMSIADARQMAAAINVQLEVWVFPWRYRRGFLTIDSLLSKRHRERHGAIDPEPRSLFVELAVSVLVADCECVHCAERSQRIAIVD